MAAGARVRAPEPQAVSNSAGYSSWHDAAYHETGSRGSGPCIHEYPLPLVAQLLCRCLDIRGTSLRLTHSS